MKTNKMPALFLGHGSPMNAVLDNDYTRALSLFGQSLPRPKAILVVSAHWLTKGTYVLEEEKPKMIYDMYGFPDELYKVQYPAPGAPDYARITSELAENQNILMDSEWGFDHGNWSVLKWLFPEADIPVYQLSIDYRQPMSYHYNLAQEISKIREKGVMVIGSGNITHNLRIIHPDVNAFPLDWAVQFDNEVRDILDRREDDKLVKYQQIGKEAELAIPEPSHWIPLLYTLGVSGAEEPLEYFYEGIQHSSFSMRCVRVG